MTTTRDNGNLDVLEALVKFALYILEMTWYNFVLTTTEKFRFIATNGLSNARCVIYHIFILRIIVWKSLFFSDLLGCLNLKVENAHPIPMLV